jgi:RNA polymerase sigma-70 factor (family 1)
MENVKHASLPNESELVRLAALGDGDAFSKIYQFYIPRLYKYIYPFIKSKEDTEEIFHDLFLSLWVKREELLLVRSLNGFIFKAARNRLINLYDHQKVKRTAFDYISKTADNRSVGTDGRVLYNQYQSILGAAIHSMPSRRRQIYEMNTLQDLSYDVIADQLGISKSVVKKQIYAARNHIKEYLQVHAGISTVILLAASTTACLIAN